MIISISFQELSGWDKRHGYEISFTTTGQATPSGAISGWKSSSAHYEVILGKGIWDSLKTVGCMWRASGAAAGAHCWFADTKI